MQARTAPRPGGAGLVVEEITRVQSVDLVADPATTRGLYEAEGLGTRGLGLETREAGVGPDEKNTELTRLRSQLQEVESRYAAVLLDQSITEELAAAEVPAPLVTELFRGQLRAAGSRIAWHGTTSRFRLISRLAITASPRTGRKFT